MSVLLSSICCAKSSANNKMLHNLFRMTLCKEFKKGVKRKVSTFQYNTLMNKMTEFYMLYRFWSISYVKGAY